MQAKKETKDNICLLHCPDTRSLTRRYPCSCTHVISHVGRIYLLRTPRCNDTMILGRSYSAGQGFRGAERAGGSLEPQWTQQSPTWRSWLSPKTIVAGKGPLSLSTLRIRRLMSDLILKQKCSVRRRQITGVLEAVFPCFGNRILS